MGAPVAAGLADKQLFLETQELTWIGSSTQKNCHDEASGILLLPPPGQPGPHRSCTSSTEWRTDSRLSHPQHHDIDASSPGRRRFCKGVLDREPEAPQGEFWPWWIWPPLGLQQGWLWISQLSPGRLSPGPIPSPQSRRRSSRAADIWGRC